MNYRNNDGLTEWEVRRVFSLALEKWASVTNLRFVEITSGEPDIWLKFVYGRHGDKYPFASSSSVLAHAFYPFPGNKGKNRAMPFGYTVVTRIELYSSHFWAIS